MPAWGIAGIVIAVILIFGLCIIIWFLARRKILALQEIVEDQIETERQYKLGSVSEIRYHNMPPTMKDEWEIERKFVSVDYSNKLGEGAFGSVYCGRVVAKNLPNGTGRSVVELAELNKNNDTVAVKMLHDSADIQTERDFRLEIDAMKRIGYHERLVNVLACVTLSDPVLLITEYCHNGDLLEFMRQRRTYMIETPENHDEEKIITAKKQIMFAIQVAYGLEYISSRGFIHRDIAARNILVDERETCKIGDFGLCRIVGKKDDNYLAHGGKLPLKWMSPEAIDKYQFSVASDVWSFGILLYEILTLGGVPYAGWPAAEQIISRSNSQHELKRRKPFSFRFEIVLDCWADLPSERPSFTLIRKRLGVLLEDVNQDNYYLKLNPSANYYVLES
ncbi:hypothetical protein PMAYCL1PPCAC_23077, partial [Pristionchus mayeri]